MNAAEAYRAGWDAFPFRPSNDPEARSEQIAVAIAAARIGPDVESPFTAGWADRESGFAYGTRGPK